MNAQLKKLGLLSSRATLVLDGWIVREWLRIAVDSKKFC